MVKIVIATHKEYKMPKDKMYLPVFLGAEGKFDSEGKQLSFGYITDNTGDNISVLNPSFCELTGLYWAWKNLDSDYIGLVHYRRHFSIKKKNGDVFNSIISYEEISPYLKEKKVFVPRKRHYYIETLYSHYAHTHYANHLDETRNIIEERYPEYLNSCDKIYNNKSGYMFNMMIMQKDLLSKYCAWLFDILFELKSRTKTEINEQLSAFQGRFYGRVSEILFNVWLDYNLQSGVLKKQEIKELKCIFLEKTNWLRKGSAFLKAKFFNKKYENSF